MKIENSITVLGVITIVLGITSYVNSAALSKARKQFDDLENRIATIETKDGYSVTNSDGSVFVQEKNGTRRWYRSAADMPKPVRLTVDQDAVGGHLVKFTSTNNWSDEFAAGVRFGLIAKAQNPIEDNIRELTKLAYLYRSTVTNWHEQLSK